MIIFIIILRILFKKIFIILTYIYNWIIKIKYLKNYILEYIYNINIYVKYIYFFPLVKWGKHIGFK